MNYRNIMYFSQLIFLVSVLIIKSTLCDTQTFKRKGIRYLNPGCDINCPDNNINIVYIKAISSEDVLHILYGGGNITDTLSAVIIRSTDTNSTISIDWKALVSNNESIFNSIKLNGANFTSFFGIIFTKLFAYPDNNAKAFNLTQEWNFNDFQWDTIIEEDFKKNKYILFKTNHLKSNNNIDLFSKNESFISIKFMFENSSKPNDDMPHLRFNANNTQFDLILKNLNVSGLNIPKFVIQFGLVNGLDKGKMNVDKIKSLDDESSPGVFITKNFYGQNKNEKFVNKTYVQWKPVCFTTEHDTSLNSITLASNDDPKSIFEEVNPLTTIDIIKSSIVYFVFGEKIIKNGSSFSLMNVTFGTDEDKGYKDYIIWSASFGFGTPPSYNISLTIIMVLVFGVGLSFVLVVVGSIYLIVKKRLNRLKSNPYVTIDEKIN